MLNREDPSRRASRSHFSEYTVVQSRQVAVGMAPAAASSYFSPRFSVYTHPFFAKGHSLHLWVFDVKKESKKRKFSLHATREGIYVQYYTSHHTSPEHPNYCRLPPRPYMGARPVKNDREQITPRAFFSFFTTIATVYTLFFFLFSNVITDHLAWACVSRTSKTNLYIYVLIA